MGKVSCILNKQNVHFCLSLLLFSLQALLNNSYLYHMAHGKDFESRGIESKYLKCIYCPTLFCFKPSPLLKVTLLAAFVDFLFS